MEDKLSPKIASLFVCEKCDYKCSKHCDFNKHLLTLKHQKDDAEDILDDAKIATKYFCECGKEYKHRQGLWKHKKKCPEMINKLNNDETNNDDTNNNDPNQITPELIMSVLHQNKELQQMLIEQNKTIIELSKNNSMTNCNNTTNSHNKSFNLNFFLNETCKDAMNIMDFVDSLKLQLSDLENVGKLGFVEGISKIIVSNLNSLDETKRPVHCTDSKREVMYVKDEDKWEKENENKQKMRKVIKHVTHKNSKLLKDFKNKYPGCEKSESKFSTTYDKLIIEAMGGKGDNDAEKEDKIIKKIAKNVSIDKYIE
jgi:hypothetical protein